MDWMQQHWIDLTAIIGGTVTLASMLVKLTPTGTDDRWINRVIALLNILALNPKNTR